MLLLAGRQILVFAFLVQIKFIFYESSCSTTGKNQTEATKSSDQPTIQVIKDELKSMNQSADYDDEDNPFDDNYPNGYKLIKEETIEEILDLEPDAKSPQGEVPQLSAQQEDRGVNSTYDSKREPRQIIRIDKPREDGRTRITVSANLLRDKMMMLGQNSRNNLFHDLSRTHLSSDLSTRIVRVPQRIIIADGGMMSAPPTRRPIHILPPAQNLSTLPPAQPVRGTYPVPETHHLIAKSDSRCPKWGHTTFEHPTECDKYFFCEGGMISEQTCPNGLVYGTFNTIVDYCIYRWEATCGDKSIPNPVSSPGCRWQYGLSTVQGSPRCSQNYYECKAGKYEIKQCPLDGQVYDDLSKSCREGKTVGCAMDALADFHCPHDDQSNHYWPFPRYFLNDKTIIHCINDRPELVKCNSDERVDLERLHCIPTGDRVRVEEKIPEILEQGRNRMRDNRARLV